MRYRRRPTVTHPLGRNSSLRARFGYSLQVHRLKSGLTQAAVAERADLSLKHLGNIERGTANTTIENMEVLGRVLKWDPFAEALMASAPGIVDSARLVLRAELKHITDTIALVLNELEPLAEASTAQREGADGASV
jgi:transcriptional regulator with XRE-family HTH domain